MSNENGEPQREYKLPEWMLHNHSERIAVLEFKDKDRVAQLSRIEEALDKILDNQSHQKGTIGGIALVFSGIAAVLMIGRDWLFSHFK